MAEIHTLDNGVRLITKHISTANSISVGVFSLVGLVQEPDDHNGIAHFLEHMSFKGTLKRSAKKITESIDNMGGVLNAHTTKEYTCYYFTVLPHFCIQAMDVLFDLYLNSVCHPKHIEMEKQVVAEEINMYEDTPDELIHDIYASSIWSDHKLGRPILGLEESVNNISQEVLLNFKKNYFNPKNVVISIAGRIEDEKKVRKFVERTFKMLDSQTKSFTQFDAKPKSRSVLVLKKKPIEQAHFCLGTEGVSFKNKDHYKVTLLSTLLGGSMSSRLFQKIRENKGWAYSIYSYASFYRESGLFTIYAGINKSRLKSSIDLILKEFDKLKDKKVTARELSKVKEQLKGNLILSLEKSSSWMNWMGRSEMYFNQIKTVDDIVEQIESVTADDLQLMACKLLNKDRFTLTALGPFKDKEADKLKKVFSNQELIPTV